MAGLLTPSTELDGPLSVGRFEWSEDAELQVLMARSWGWCVRAVCLAGSANPIHGVSLTPMLASIPSPSSNTFSIGPLTIHFYGLLIGLGVLVAIWVTMRRYGRYGGDPGLAESVSIWAVVAGLIGARAAYVIPRWAEVTSHGIWHAFAIWEGGLAFFGGLTAGAIVGLGLMLAHRIPGKGRWWNLAAFADAAAVGIPAAQAIGRWGNYMNQELFGTPSNLPWAVQIAPRFRPAQYADAATFHPAFLYESLWNAVIVIPVLLWIEKRFKIARGNMIMGYLIFYGIGRFLLEFIRTDQATHVLGFRANQLVAALAVVAALTIFLVRQAKGAPGYETAATRTSVAAAAVAAPGSDGFQEEIENATTLDESIASDEATASSDGPPGAG
jgi:prolipoprotein diacylglyceryl transferase